MVENLYEYFSDPQLDEVELRACEDYQLAIDQLERATERFNRIIGIIAIERARRNG